MSGRFHTLSARQRVERGDGGCELVVGRPHTSRGSNAKLFQMVQFEERRVVQIIRDHGLQNQPGKVWQTAQESYRLNVRNAWTHPVAADLQGAQARQCRKWRQVSCVSEVLDYKRHQPRKLSEGCQGPDTRRASQEQFFKLRHLRDRG